MSSPSRSRTHSLLFASVFVCGGVVCGLVAFHYQRWASEALPPDGPSFEGRRLTENSSVENSSNRSDRSNDTRVEPEKVVNDLFHKAHQILGLNTTEHSTWSAAKNQDVTITTLAKLHDKMPYLLIFILSFVKPVLMAVLVGPPRPGASFQVSRPIMLFLFTVMPALAVLRQDAITITGAWMSQISTWEAFMVTVAVIANSSNYSTLVCLWGLSSIYEETLKFEQFHGLKPGMGSFGVMRESYGVAGAAILKGAFYATSAVSIPMGLFIIPALVCYIWLFLPLYSAVAVVDFAAYKSVVYALDWRLRKADGSEPLPFEEEEKPPWVLEEEGKPPLLQKPEKQTVAWGAYPNERGSERYIEDLDLYKRTGAPKMAWIWYMAGPGYASIIPVVCTIALRFYCGRGYMASLTSTWNDRHLSTWADTSLSSMENSVVNFLSFLI
eukprot:TRINITY_DN13623_c0_g1_i4.p1 TRINITY_DN13623_c0_g1~~TRINITY_DN13623_c0_g1_i4.p1  ORF type:complete len:440 (+),score=65.27 TRINITY_DN13623_c0_g1_i4:67-1386(+)